MLYNNNNNNNNKSQGKNIMPALFHRAAIMNGQFKTHPKADTAIAVKQHISSSRVETTRRTLYPPSPVKLLC